MPEKGEPKKANKLRRGCLPIGCLFVVFLIIGVLAGPIGGVFSPLGIHLPEIKLSADIVFHLFGFPVGNGVIAVWVTIIFLVGTHFIAFHHMKLVPGRLQGIFELLPLWIYSICQRVTGNKDDGSSCRCFPITATIFLFVGFNAWLSLMPGYESITVNTAEGVVPLIRPANTDINMPLALALVSIGVVQFYITKGLNFRGISLRKGNRGTIFGRGIGFFTSGVEFATGFIDIVSLTFRLFGVMTAGAILIGMSTYLVPWGFPLIFYILEILLGFIQAFIFSGLILIPLSMALVAGHQGAENSKIQLQRS